MNPDVHPLQWQQLRFIGGGMVADLQAQGKQGVVTGSMYRIWGQEGALTGRYHNIVALLTETASSRIASPDTVELAALERGAAPGRGLGQYGFQMAFVDPWMGGEWKLGDIVDYQTIAALSFLEQSAKFSEHYIMGRWQMSSETIRKGEQEGPRAYVIPLDQSDPVAAAEMVDRLILQGLEIHRTTEAFEVAVEHDLWASPAGGLLDVDEDEGHDEDGEGHTDDDDEGRDDDDEGRDDEDRDDDGLGQDDDNPAPETRSFPAGSWIVYGAQPGRAAVLDLIEPRRRELLYEWPGGPYVRNYDGAAYTIPMQMGVDVIRVDDAFAVGTEAASIGPLAAPPIPSASDWYAISAQVTRSYQAVNRMLDAGLPVSKAESDDGPVFVVRASAPQALGLITEATADLGISVLADPDGVREAVPQQPNHIGLYQGWAGAMDEGWTRFVFDDFDYAYETLGNADVQADDLSDRFDVIVFPSEIPLNRLINGDTAAAVPEEFRGGIGEDGVENLKQFVRAGGTLVTLERADELVIEHFGVPVRNALEGVGQPDFYLPTSLLRVELDGEHPLTMGSPDEVAGKWAGGRAYEPTDFGGEAGRVRAVGSWAEDPERVLMSGQIVGPEFLAGKGAILDVEYGSGSILMYGFRVQHRGQTHGTFKLLFNALLKNSPRSYR
jgi:hypothetical protein